jgi:hypothetical protein
VDDANTAALLDRPVGLLDRHLADQAVDIVGAALVSGDHHNCADVGSALARRSIDAVVDLPNSAVALAVGDVVRNANRTMLVTAAVTTRLTGDACSPNAVHYAAARRLRWGETTTYGALAKALGAGPEVARDVGQAMAQNPVPLTPATASSPPEDGSEAFPHRAARPRRHVCSSSKASGRPRRQSRRSGP